MLLLLVCNGAMAQLGVYAFNGPGANCPNSNDDVTTQPANAVFSSYTTANTKCESNNSEFRNSEWNSGSTIDLNEYAQFTVNPNAGFMLNLTSLTITHELKDDDNSTWVLRSNLDGFTTNIPLPDNNIDDNRVTHVVPLPAATFTGVGAVTFRFYLINAKDNGTYWVHENVTLNGTVTAGVPSSPVQLGQYNFTGAKTCPTQNPAVTSQPANAVFSLFSTVNAKCKDDR